MSIQATINQIIVTGDVLTVTEPGHIFVNEWGNYAGVRSAGFHTEGGRVRINRLAHNTARSNAYTAAGHDEDIYSIKIAGNPVVIVRGSAVVYRNSKKTTLKKMFKKAQKSLA